MIRKRISILGVPVDIISRADLKRRLLDILTYRRGRQIVTPNPEFLLQAQNNSEFLSVLRDASLSVPDGIGLKFAAWLKGVNIRRFTGASIVTGLLGYAEIKRFRVAILNWKQGLSSDEDIKAALYKQYPKLFFMVDSLEKNQENYNVGVLKNFRPDILFVALGAPEQDIFIAHKLKELRSVRLAMGVGGSFDYITKKMPRAPRLLQFIGLEWLWRLLLKPSTRWRRIWNAVVIFPLLVIRWELRRFRYRPNVVGFIVNQFGEVLILNARGRGDYWGLPQGGTERGENIETAVRREVQEETSLTDISIQAIYKDIYEYSWSKPYTHSGYKGQRQTLCIIKYNGPVRAVKTNPFEHKAYRWVKISELLRQSSPVHKKQYELFLQKYVEFLADRKQ